MPGYNFAEKKKKKKKKEKKKSVSIVVDKTEILVLTWFPSP